jgi:hypothetical protein
MTFEDIIAVLERTFQTELAVVQDTTVFEVAGEDGGRIRVLVQDESERHRVLLSADLGEPPPEGAETLFRTMLEANNLFTGTAGATLALDAATGRFRLQKAEIPDELANDVDGHLVTFIETALDWRRAIEDFRPAGAGDPDAGDGGAVAPGGGFGVFQV